eukprot:11186785-Lingulodinium_polyedra.AAC.1
MEYLRVALDCSDAEVVQFLVNAGSYDLVFLDLQNRWGSFSAPVIDHPAGRCKRLVARIPLYAEPPLARGAPGPPPLA